jgi:predicted signal transduction protein with EAL and GGDEF domain
VNDRLGHSAGDDLLVQVSRRLQDIFRETNTLVRLGGDEFGLLVSEIEDEDAFFARIMKTLRDPFEVEGEWVTLSGSLGVTFCPPDQGGGVSPLLSHADLALYQVKNGGGDGWAPFQQEMEERIKSRHRLRFEFDRALSNGELVLHYQPQVNMTTGQVVGVEALVRWNHPDQGFLLPAAFIDVVEKSELIAPLGRFVMEEALSQQNRWKQGGLALQISVNIGARHFLSGSLHADLERVIARHNGSHPATIEIEVTETEALRDLFHAQRVIEQCHGLGIIVSLDDFGTGETSLSVLQNLSVGEIKIDQEFVRGIAESQKKQAIASGLIAIGRIMQLKVVVEGIETEEAGLFMIRMGCELAQGYGIARPMPAEAIPEWIASWKPFESWTRPNLLGSAVNGDKYPHSE